MTDWVNERAREMRQIIEEIDELRRQLTPEQLHWNPGEGQWSIGQVFEHLILTDRPSVEPLSTLIATAPRGAGSWKPTIMGRLILMAVEPATRRKTRAKKGFLPAQRPAGDVIAEYIGVRKQLLALLLESERINLNAARTRFPIRTPFRYNLGDAFMILVRHTQRHLQQIKRIRSKSEFPPENQPFR